MTQSTELTPTTSAEVREPRVTRVRELRVALQWTQVDLAVQSDISLGVVSRIENAINDEELALVGVGKFVALARALGVRPVDVYPKLGLSHETQ